MSSTNNKNKNNPFLSNYIPQDIENRILSIYTDLSIKHDEQDLTAKYLFKILSSLAINKKLLIDLQIKEYVIPNTNILDIDILISKLTKLVILNDHISTIVKNWLLLLKLLSVKEEEIFQYRLSVKELQKLSQELSLSQDTNLINMISICGKTYVNFVDFGIILGKLNQL